MKLNFFFQKICEMNIIWDDSTGELHSRWSKIFFSSHVENATLNRCYFMNEINDPVDTI